MLRRMETWTSKGFIHNLSRIPFDKLKINAQQHNPDLDKKSNDNFCLLVRREGTEIQNIYSRLRDRIPQTEGKPDNLNTLLTAVEQKGKDAYNADTCVELHCLLLVLFIGYGEALAGCAQACQDQAKRLARAENKKTGKKARAEAEARAKTQDLSLTKDVWTYGRYLWRITSSRMFEGHLQVLCKARASISPLFSEAGLYVKSVVFKDPGPGDERAPGGKWSKREDGGGGVGGTRGQDSDPGMPTGYEKEDVEEDQRMGRAASVSSNTSDLKADYPDVRLFEHWTRTITSYFTALRLLAVRASKPNIDTIEMSLIVANHFDGHSVEPLDWHEAIYGLCTPHEEAQPPTTITPPDQPDATSNDSIDLGPQPPSEDSQSPASFTTERAAEVIKLLQDFIDHTTPAKLHIISSFGRNKQCEDLLAPQTQEGTTLEFGSSTPTDDSTKPSAQDELPIGKVAWVGNQHCELVAAAVSKYLDIAVPDDATLRQLISVRFMLILVVFIQLIAV